MNMVPPTLSFTHSFLLLTEPLGLATSLLAMVVRMVSKLSTFVATASHNNRHWSWPPVSPSPLSHLRRDGTTHNRSGSEQSQMLPRTSITTTPPVTWLLSSSRQNFCLDNNRYLLQTGNGTITSGSVLIIGTISLKRNWYKLI